MGKVGSSSLRGTLDRYKFRSLHIHRYYFSNNERPPINPKPLWWKLKYNTTLERFLKADKVKVITFYRDPLPRNISSFFQNLDIYFSRRERRRLTFEILEKKFNESFRFHNTPNNWFDFELKRKLGIDIFETPFDKERGFTIIKKNNIELFVCITNKISSLEGELASFLEIEEFKLISENVAENKWYKDLYKEFKKKYKPSEEMLETLYSSKTINHFFSPKTIEALKNKWL